MHLHVVFTSTNDLPKTFFEPTESFIYLQKYPQSFVQQTTNVINPRFTSNGMTSTHLTNLLNPYLDEVVEEEQNIQDLAQRHFKSFIGDFNLSLVKLASIYSKDIPYTISDLLKIALLPKIFENLDPSRALELFKTNYALDARSVNSFAEYIQSQFNSTEINFADLWRSVGSQGNNPDEGFMSDDGKLYFCRKTFDLSHLFNQNISFTIEVNNHGEVGYSFIKS